MENPTDHDAPAGATTFVVVRHGQTEWNAAGRWQGWLDSPLTELGRDQARLAGQALHGEQIDVAYSSDSPRALDTARLALEIAGHPQLAVHPTSALRERFYGDYEGLNTDEIEARFPGTRYNRRRDTRDDWRPPGVGAENLVEVRARVESFLKNLTRRHPAQSVLLITHSNVVRILDALASSQSLEAIWSRTPPNACVFILRGWIETDTLHLQVLRHFCATE